MSPAGTTPWPRSLQRKLLLPLGLIGGVVAVIALWAIQRASRQQLETKLHQRAELVANMVNYVAESVSHAGELQRIVSSIGAEPDILEILVVGGRPARVLAGTKFAWYDQPLSALPDAEVGEDLNKALQTRASYHHFNAPEHRFAYSAPLLLTQDSLTGGSLTDGAVMVHLDTFPLQAAIRRSTRETFLIFLGGAALVSLLGYALLDRFVLRPVAAINEAVKDGRETTAATWAAATPDDELGTLASTLRTTLAGMDAALYELQNQKSALDQHAIVAVTDPKGIITYANDLFCTITGYTHAELLGQNHRLLNSDTHPKSFFTEMWTTIVRGRVWRGEICNRAKNGALYWVDSSVVPLRDPHGKPTGYIAIRTDITARKATEQALREAKDAAEAATRAKSSFLATMSHEIRTPMNGVLGFTDLLLDTPLNGTQLDYTTTIKNSGECLLALINDILDFSKIEAGKLTLDPQPFDLGQTLQEVLGLLAARAKEKALELRIVYPPHLPRLLVADASRLRQIALNLVANALKFTEHGSVTLRVSAEPVPDEPGGPAIPHVAAGVPACGSDDFGPTPPARRPVAPPDPGAAAARFLRIEITDTGIGIPPELQGQLFQQFIQADSSTTRRFGGTGLGLAISKRLVELMGGQIGVESQPGAGSTFWFTWPLIAAPASARLPPASAPLPRPATNDGRAVTPVFRLRVLVAEDNLTNQILVTTLLRKCGCQADVATNGAEAVALFQRQRYDLILMDCHMPGRDGFEATAAIRHLEALATGSAPRTPIIALTASVMQEDQTRCREVGMDGMLNKPLRPEELKEILTRWGHRARPPAEQSHSSA